MSIWETNCVIHWEEIHPLDSATHLLNNWGQTFSFVVCDTGEEFSMTATNLETHLAHVAGPSMLYHGCTSWRSSRAQVHGLSERYALCAVRKKNERLHKIKGTSSDLSWPCRNQLLSLSLILQLYWLANVLTIYCFTIYYVMDSVGSPRGGYLTNF